MKGGTIREAANLYRRVVFGAVTLLCLFPIAGETAHTVGGLAVIGSLLLYMVQGLGMLRLTLSWHVGYLMIIVLEGLRNADEIRALVDTNAYDEASRYVTAANAAALFVRSMLFDEREPEIVDVRAEKSRDQIRVGLLIFALYVIFIAIELPAAMSFSQQGVANIGGSGAPRSAQTAIQSGLITSIGISLPGLIIFYLRYSLRFSPRIGLIAMVPVLLTLYLTGVRFLVLFSAAGALAAYLPVERGKKVPFGRLVSIGAIIYFFASTMAIFRTNGLDQFTLSSVEDYYRDHGGMHSEGTVATLAKMANYSSNRELMLGRSSSTLLLFWIPREFWPNKPTFIDHWFIREYEGEQSFSQGFSTGSSFAADAFFDFGFHGGILYCGVFFGFLLMSLERASLKVLSRKGSPLIVIIAPLYGGLLFSVRSFNTTIIQMSGVFAIGLLFVVLSDPAQKTEREK